MGEKGEEGNAGPMGRTGKPVSESVVAMHDMTCA